MAPIDVAVRSPTNWAWGTSVCAIIAGGELAYLVRRGETLSVSGVELTRGALIAGAVIAGWVAVVALAWLVSLYLRPGRFLVDPERELVVREMRPYVALRVVSGRLADWSIRLVFYSQHTRELGSFKRLELNGPEAHEEVLFFTDVPRGEAVAEALTQLEGTACDFAVVVERQQGTRAGDVSPTKT